MTEATNIADRFRYLIEALLADLLEDPAMVKLFQAAPALARHLRPLCHMLGVKLPKQLRPPPTAPSPPAPATPTAPATRATFPPAPLLEPGGLTVSRQERPGGRPAPRQRQR